jgi:DNA end-binding protein Ku
VVATAPERGKVINLMDALRQSLDADRKPPAKSRPRKEDAEKPAAKSSTAKRKRSSAA